MTDKEDPSLIKMFCVTSLMISMGPLGFQLQMHAGSSGLLEPSDWVSLWRRKIKLSGEPGE